MLLSHTDVCEVLHESVAAFLEFLLELVPAALELLLRVLLLVHEDLRPESALEVPAEDLTVVGDVVCFYDREDLTSELQITLASAEYFLQFLAVYHLLERDVLLDR